MNGLLKPKGEFFNQGAANRYKSHQMNYEQKISFEDITHAPKISQRMLEVYKIRPIDSNQYKNFAIQKGYKP